MPRPRFNKLDPEKQEQILEAAADEFGAHGFDAASINKIIERAGISKGAAYYYFDDKSDLYITVIESALRRIKRWVGGWGIEDLDADNFWEELHAAMTRSLSFLRENAWASSLFKTFWDYADRHRDDRAIRLMWVAARNFGGAFIERGQELGRIRADIPNELLVDILIGSGTAVDRWLVANLDDMNPEDLDETAVLLIDLFRRILEPPENR